MAGLLAAGVMAPWAHAGSHHGNSTAENSFVIRAGKIMPVSRFLPWVIEDGLLVVRDGKVVAVGNKVDLPPDLPVFDFPDAVIMPGLVSAASELVPEHGGDETAAGGYFAADAFLSHADYSATLAGGVTTVHLSPGRHRLITGQGAVVQLAGPASERILRFNSDLAVNLGEGVFGPPNLVEYRTPASSDVAIPPSVRQRPASRMGQFLALEEVIAGAILKGSTESDDIHAMALASAWRRGMRLRVNVDREADIENAMAFLKRHGRAGYLVGGAEVGSLGSKLVGAALPLVYRAHSPLGSIGDDLGYDPEVIEADMDVLNQLTGVELALSVAENQRIADLRMVAAIARRSGIGEKRVIDAITRIPAKILGVDDRVGSLSPGMMADFLVLSGEPLATTTHVQRVYVRGQLGFEAPDTDALVVRAGTIWVDEDTRYENGSVLIENGRVTDVGHSVPHPPFARFYDAGSDAFVSPGWIDAYGHLGLDGDTSAPNPALSLSKLIGSADVTDRRVARAGVTTVMLSPYRANPMGSQVSAIKTLGSNRLQRVVRDAAAVTFTFNTRTDPMAVTDKLKKRFKAAQAYREKWQKYEKELEEWKEKKAKGELEDIKPKTEEAKEEGTGPDPITGTWSVTVSGGPIPEPATGKLRMKLTGSDIEGRLLVPGAPEQVKVVGTLEGEHISAEIQIDTGGMGYPQIEADIVEEDRIVGTISFQNLEANLDATRIDKGDVEFKVVKRRTRGKGGRPLPPKIDEALEPLRAVLDNRIPIVVSVRTAAQINAALAVLETYEISMVLEGAEEAAAVADRLDENVIGVIVPRTITRWVNNQPYHQADDLSRRGLEVMFQSRAEDGARTLPLLALHAVERGMSPDSALRAMTTTPARMFLMQDEIGSLRVGCQGDMVIFNGHPFETGSRVERVIIGGEVVR
ncbi:MAG: amidohydrolase family protein [Planctomycetota bacterium]|jgi:imidazolonepropionase-like amidohydrolase